MNGRFLDPGLAFVVLFFFGVYRGEGPVMSTLGLVNEVILCNGRVKLLFRQHL